MKALITLIILTALNIFAAEASAQSITASVTAAAIVAEGDTSTSGQHVLHTDGTVTNTLSMVGELSFVVQTQVCANGICITVNSSM